VIARNLGHHLEWWGICHGYAYIYLFRGVGVLIDSKNIEHELHSIRNRIIVIGLGQCQALLIDSKNIEHELHSIRNRIIVIGLGQCQAFMCMFIRACFFFYFKNTFKKN
jgi:hypothetical protein